MIGVDARITRAIGGRVQTELLLAGALVLLIGLVHSVLGEVLIFRRMRRGGLIPTMGEPLLRERHVRILWASWHLPSILGWAFGVLLISIAAAAGEPVAPALVVRVMAVSLAVGSALVLVATKGRHPGWLGLLAAAAQAWLGQPAV